MILKLAFRSVLVFLFVFVFQLKSEAQTKYYSKSKKAIKVFESALYNYNLGNFPLAKQKLAESLAIDEKFLDVFILYGEIANEENDKVAAIDYYKKAISLDKNYNPLMYLRLADLQKETGKYKEAIIDYQTFLRFGKLLKDYQGYVNDKIKQCNYAIELMKHPVEFEPINLGEAINTPMSEYWPSLTADDSTLVFTSSNRETNSQEDLYFSVKKNGKWQNAIKIGPPINTERSEGAQSISADGKTMVFTACLRPDGYGSCDLYISWKKGEKWTTPINMGQPINGKYKESQPSLSADGKTIYFSSNRPGGNGKFDIWQSTTRGNNIWETPINLGDSINTSEDELAPFIHYDDNTLYFTSEGHPGMGGSDLFISGRNEKGQWSAARNLGYPVNSHYNEESLIVTANGNLGMFSSNMAGGFGQKDIYLFEMPPGIKPHKTIFIKGIVFDAKTKKPLYSEIEIVPIGSETIILTESDETSGEFLACLTPKNNYAFHVDKKGYMMFSENFLLPDSNIYIKIPLQPIQKGETAILKNIFFEFDSFALKKESFAELIKLKNFVIKNKLSIEIQGHTDSIGTETYNLKLSANRAKSVYEYLIEQGVKKESLRFKGYGYSQPIESNSTEAGRAKNRRTEFKILSF